MTFREKRTNKQTNKKQQKTKKRKPWNSCNLYIVLDVKAKSVFLLAAGKIGSLNIDTINVVV